MSRAFVKETDGVGDPLPERVVSPHPNLVTAHGAKLMDAEIVHLRDARVKAHTDDDREAQARIARDLRYWTARRASAQVIPDPQDDGTVQFGSRVTIERDDGRRQTFRIVGEDEAEPSRGTLSHVSPVARTLLGRKVGDTIQAGRSEATIVEIG